MKRWLVVFIVALLVLCGCQREEAHLDEQPMTQAEIEQFAGIHFPPGVRDVLAHSEAGIDRLLLVRFTLDAETLEDFMRDSHFAGQLEEGYRPFPTTYGAGLSWWNAQSAQHFSGIQDRWGGVVRQMMVDSTTPGIVIVYLVVFET